MKESFWRVVDAGVVATSVSVTSIVEIAARINGLKKIGIGRRNKRVAGSLPTLKNLKSKDFK